MTTTELLRFATSGSVDDGKSTLIGRLLYDSKQVMVDQLEHLEQVSARRNGGANGSKNGNGAGPGQIDLSLLTDGLRAEREQGITIDVAYRYFQTARRKFIIADTPGHAEYTRNMVTGASTADLSLALVDAQQGVVEQSKRHAYIASLLRIPHLVVCVNKMDLVDWDESRYDEIAEDFADYVAPLGIHDVTFIPISALLGDNVVERSLRMPWYQGPTVLHHLEHVHIASDRNLVEARFPVQWVIRTPDYRGYAGQVAGGVLSVGDEVVVLPSGRRSRIAAIDGGVGEELEEAFPPMSVALRLQDDVDVSRGDLIARPDDAPEPAREVVADVCWMADAPLREGGRYAIKHTTRAARAVVDAVEHRIDVHTLRPDCAGCELGLNDIGRVRLRLSTPLVADPYASNRTTGSFILMDEATNETVGAGMIAGAGETPWMAGSP